uniref:Uncharacterized protein n=1 Tax=Stegastes partitus TaxID=144197 RepID=A0A3B5AUC0_9TELE
WRRLVMSVCVISLGIITVLELEDDISTIYQARTLNGSCTVNLSDYRGKSVLFVNVATY